MKYKRFIGLIVIFAVYIACVVIEILITLDDIYPYMIITLPFALLVYFSSKKLSGRLRSPSILKLVVVSVTFGGILSALWFCTFVLLYTWSPESVMVMMFRFFEVSWSYSWWAGATIGMLVSTVLRNRFQYQSSDKV